MHYQECVPKSESCQSLIISSSLEKLNFEKEEKITQNLNNRESQSTLCLSTSKDCNPSHLSTVTKKSHLKRRNTTGPGMIFSSSDLLSDSYNENILKISPLQSPHLDKRFFDSSLVEMKSQASSSSTLDYDSTEEIWIRRIDISKQENYNKVSIVFYYNNYQQLFITNFL